MSEVVNLRMVFEGESILRPGCHAAGTVILVHGIEGMHSCQTLKKNHAA